MKLTYTEKENLHAGSSLAVIFGEGLSQDEFYLKNIVSQLSRDPAPEDPSKPDEPPMENPPKPGKEPTPRDPDEPDEPPMEKPGEGPDEPPQDPREPDEKRPRKSPRKTPKKRPPKGREKRNKVII
jgi:outer membrane biosynthesis protein TonB